MKTTVTAKSYVDDWNWQNDAKCAMRKARINLACAIGPEIVDRFVRMHREGDQRVFSVSVVVEATDGEEPMTERDK